MCGEGKQSPTSNACPAIDLRVIVEFPVGCLGGVAWQFQKRRWILTAEYANFLC
jgi:hypothetical protein